MYTFTSPDGLKLQVNPSQTPIGTTLSGPGFTLTFEGTSSHSNTPVRQIIQQQTHQIQQNIHQTHNPQCVSEYVPLTHEQKVNQKYKEETKRRHEREIYNDLQRRYKIVQRENERNKQRLLREHTLDLKLQKLQKEARILKKNRVAQRVEPIPMHPTKSISYGYFKCPRCGLSELEYGGECWCRNGHNTIVI